MAQPASLGGVLIAARGLAAAGSGVDAARLPTLRSLPACLRSLRARCPPADEEFACLPAQPACAAWAGCNHQPASLVTARASCSPLAAWPHASSARQRQSRPSHADAARATPALPHCLSVLYMIWQNKFSPTIPPK